MMFIVSSFISAIVALFSAFAPVSTYSRETADSSEPDAFDRAWHEYEAMCDLRLMQILNSSEHLDPMDEQMIVDILHDRGFKETRFVYVGDDDDIDPYSDALLNPIEDDWDYIDASYLGEEEAIWQMEQAGLRERAEREAKEVEIGIQILKSRGILYEDDLRNLDYDYDPFEELREDFIAEKEACYIYDDEPAMHNNDPIVDDEDERVPFDIYTEEEIERNRLQSALALNLIIRENRKIDLLMDDIAAEKCVASVRTILAKAEIRRCRELLQEIKRSKPHIAYRTLNVHT